MTTISTTGPQAWIDTVNAGALSIQLTGLWSGAVVVEGSNNQIAGSPTALTLGDVYGSTQDTLTSSGEYVLEVTTRYVRLNVLSLSGTITASVITRAQVVDPSTSVLGLAADEGSGVALGTRPKIKLDAQSAVVLADASGPFYGGSGGNNALVISQLDTIGYESIAVQIFGTFVATATMYSSNDGLNWTPVAGWPVGGSATPSTTVAAAGLWSVPAVGRYFCIQTTAYTSGNLQAACVLRAQAPVHIDSVAATIASNMTQISGQPIVTAGVNGTQAVGGNVATGVAATANPLLLGGVDAAGLTRRLLTDTSGRPISALQAQLYASQSPQQVPPIAVQDQTYGDSGSVGETLQQMLIELRIHNLYLQELPRLLQSASYALDDATVLRQDPSLLQT